MKMRSHPLSSSHQECLPQARQSHGVTVSRNDSGITLYILPRKVQRSAWSHAAVDPACLSHPCCQADAQVYHRTGEQAHTHTIQKVHRMCPQPLAWHVWAGANASIMAQIASDALMTNVGPCLCLHCWAYNRLTSDILSLVPRPNSMHSLRVGKALRVPLTCPAGTYPTYRQSRETMRRDSTAT